MKLTHAQLRTAHGVLHQIAAVKALPMSARYRVYQLLRAVEGPVSDSDRALQAVLEAHTERDEAGAVVYTTDQGGEQAAVIRDPIALRLAQAEALAVEVKIDAEPLRASELGEALGEVSPAALAAMGPLFEWNEGGCTAA